MPRHLRVLYPGAIYHVTVRGNGRQAIFKDDADRERLLERLAESVESCGVRVYLYCLQSGGAVGLQARRAQQTCNKNDVKIRAAIEADLQGQMAVAK